MPCGKIKLEEVGLIPLVQVKPSLSFTALGGIEHEVHAACAFGIFQQRNVACCLVRENPHQVLVCHCGFVIIDISLVAKLAYLSEL